eukprot:gene9173-6600_t
MKRPSRPLAVETAAASPSPHRSLGLGLRATSPFGDTLTALSPQRSQPREAAAEHTATTIPPDASSSAS